MSRALVVIQGPSSRARAMNLLQRVPEGTRVEFRGARRTIPQNSKFWALLSDVATQKEHAGRKYTADQWRSLFMHACGRETEFAPSLDNSTFLPLGYSSRELSKAEMSELIEFILAWGTENGVVFSDPTMPQEEDAEIAGSSPFAGDASGDEVRAATADSAPAVTGGPASPKPTGSPPITRSP